MFTPQYQADIEAAKASVIHPTDGRIWSVWRSPATEERMADWTLGGTMGPGWAEWRGRQLIAPLVTASGAHAVPSQSVAVPSGFVPASSRAVWPLISAGTPR